MSKPITLDEFIRRSIVKHGHKYDYSKVKYKNQYDMVDIICPIHGEFSQMVKSHMNGSSCRKCSQVEVAKKLKGVKKVNLLDKETIINRLMNIYDYEVRWNTKVKLIEIKEKMNIVFLIILR